MGLYFKNETQETLWIVFARPDPDHVCDNDGFTVDYFKRGWYSVAPGAEVKVYSGWVGGDAWFYYAEADDFSPVWSGDFAAAVPDHAFDACWEVGYSTGRRLGFRRVRPGAEIMDYTVRLRL
jgi:hypothetical protein